ncbi:MAG: bifunctional demethylmenaquinone methyltransferase/2-methoxy-6-polyprenyl-1,4-benzoquinol methylase UbiE [Bacteroidetes bacterium]|nr:MAG: bifunctional demethylmenaquinone methyltransferase/2-methoxy-6-polyprenyl-1,4-benzoquinol methylase UbiE [Bacteroidota bacterium]
MVVTPYSNASEGKREQVEQMFNDIAFRYDLLNHLLSFGIHNIWRKKAIRLLNSRLQTPDSLLLDVATGTADFAIDALKLNPRKIIGIDISEDMLAIGRKKIQEKNLTGIVDLVKADTENLPFPENHFDTATVGFGVRNFESLEKGLSEIRRTLKKDGTLAVLEFSIPEKFPMKQLFYFYLKYYCPLLGKIISKNPVAYTYLFESVRNFPYGEKFKRKLLDCGFSQATVHPQTFGIVTIYIAKK